MNDKHYMEEQIFSVYFGEDLAMDINHRSYNKDAIYVRFSDNEDDRWQDTDIETLERGIEALQDIIKRIKPLMKKDGK